MMTVRAASAAQTAERIVEATRQLFADKVIGDITLADIAAHAGVTVQTVLRRFGDKDGVFAAAFERFAEEVLAQRGEAVPNALQDAVANLVAHYEQWGRLMVKMLAEEATTPAIPPVLAAGRDYHRRWCETVFSGSLASLEGRDRDRRLAQLVAICDLRTWETLRITSQLSRAQTELALLDVLEPLVTKGK